MIAVNFANTNIKIKTENDINFVYDAQRKKWIILTAEEWVRQHLISFFITHCKYPKKHIAVEKQIIVNTQKKRFDILIYNSALQPWLIVECKEPDTLLNDEVLQQILSYQSALKAAYFVISNGTNTYLYTLNYLGAIISKTEWPKWC